MRHENIVRVLAFDEGSPERPPCMVMERMEESLSSFLEIMTSPPSLVERLETIKDVSKVSFRSFPDYLYEQRLSLLLTPC